MSQQPFSLDQIDVASPCGVAWDRMTGNETVRYCDHCRLNVYNLSGMTRAEAETLVREKEGNLCVGFYRRADGTLLTRDCPVGWRAIRRRVVQRVAAFASLLFALLFGTSTAGADGRYRGSRCIRWLDGVPSTKDAVPLQVEPKLLEGLRPRIPLDIMTLGRIAPPKNLPAGLLPPKPLPK